MINVEGFKAFHGDLIVKPVNGNKPFTVTGDWLYKPDCDCWYGGGRSYSADICEAVEVDMVAELEELAIQQGAELNRRAELFYSLESRHKEAMELLGLVKIICGRTNDVLILKVNIGVHVLDRYEALKAKESGGDTPRADQIEAGTGTNCQRQELEEEKQL